MTCDTSWSWATIFVDVVVTRHDMIDGRADDTLRWLDIHLRVVDWSVVGQPPLLLWVFLTSFGQWAVGDVCDVFETWCRDGEAGLASPCRCALTNPWEMTWWGERWHRDSTPTNVKKERAWEYSTWSDTSVVATHFYMFSCAPTCHGSDHSVDEGFNFWRRDCYEVWQQTLRTQN